MNTSNLVPGSSSTAVQLQALADLCARATAWANTIVFGKSNALNGASIAAKKVIEVDKVPVMRGGEMRLICDYKPILQVLGVDIGLDMASLATVGPSVASSIRIGERTLYVPFTGIMQTWPPNQYFNVDDMVAVWQYVAGYPHTSLAATCAAGQATITLTPTDGATGLLGIFPGVVMTVIDQTAGTGAVAQTESFTVQSVTGNVVTATSNFLHTHTVPTAPDFIPVTCLPDGVRLATLYLLTTLLKTRGDSSMVIDDIVEPRQIKHDSGDLWADFKLACNWLKPYKIRMKSPR